MIVRMSRIALSELVVIRMTFPVMTIPVSTGVAWFNPADHTEQFPFDLRGFRVETATLQRWTYTSLTDFFAPMPGPGFSFNCKAVASDLTLWAVDANAVDTVKLDNSHFSFASEIRPSGFRLNLSTQQSMQYQLPDPFVIYLLKQ